MRGLATSPQTRQLSGRSSEYGCRTTFQPSRKLPHAVTGRIAALAATYAIELKGCQEHFYSVDDFARRYVAAVIARCGGNREAAAAALGISLRSLYRYQA